MILRHEFAWCYATEDYLCRHCGRSLARAGYDSPCPGRRPR
jgi:hypothetical protein